MTGREQLLADIEAKRLEADKRERAGKPVEILGADLKIVAEDTGYDPYDNPGHAKPLDVDYRGETSRKRKRR